MAGVDIPSRRDRGLPQAYPPPPVTCSVDSQNSLFIRQMSHSLRSMDTGEEETRYLLKRHIDFVIDSGNFTNLHIDDRHLDKTYIVFYDSREVMVRVTHLKELTLILKHGLRDSALNIISFYGYATLPSADDRYLFVMEKPVCNLEELLNKPKIYDHGSQNISDRHKINMALDLARGMKYLHGKGIIHFNLHPCKIMMCTCSASTEGNFLEAKIADFSQSKSYDKNVTYTMNDLKFCVEEISYPLAPELRPAADPGMKFDAETMNATDVYAFGVVVAQLSMENDNAKTALDKIRGERNHAPATDLWSYDIVFKCTNEDPKERPSAQMLVEEIKEMECSTTSTKANPPVAVPESSNKSDSAAVTDDQQTSCTQELQSNGAPQDEEPRRGRRNWWKDLKEKLFVPTEDSRRKLSDVNKSV